MNELKISRFRFIYLYEKRLNSLPLLCAELFVVVADLFKVFLHLSHVCDFLYEMVGLHAEAESSLRDVKGEVPELLILEGKDRHLVWRNIHTSEKDPGLLNQCNAVHVTHLVVDDHQRHNVHLVFIVHVSDSSQNGCTTVVEAGIVEEFKLLK